MPTPEIAAPRPAFIRNVFGPFLGFLRALAGLALPFALVAACQLSPLVMAEEAALAQGAFPRGAGQFVFRAWAGPPITVWTYAPEHGSLADLPVVVVMHGVGRDGDRYRDEWIETARDQNLIVLAPNFSNADFPKAAGYNLGNRFDERSGAAIDEELWSFSAIDPLFEDVVRSLGSSQTSFALYGHSAGAQFVHRYLYFKPHTRADVFLVANAGWYTMPNLETAFPYGLEGAGLDPLALRHALQAEVVVLLGEKDTDRTDPNLRRTPEAMAQGPHRFARGQAFFQAAREVASGTGVTFGWQLVTVPLAHHSNALMAPAAAAFIRDRATNR